MYEDLPDLIVYLRHPQCMHNVNSDKALRQGIENKHSPLTSLGEAQRDITSKFLCDEFGSFDAVFASEYVRTHTLPEASGFGDQMVIDPLLNERSMGIWHRLPSLDVRKLFPGEEKKLTTVGYYYYLPPEGESCVDVEQRQQSFLAKSHMFTGVDKLLVSGHGTAGRCFRKILLGSDLEDWHKWNRLDNASVTIYEKQGERFVCSMYNYVPWAGLL